MNAMALSPFWLLHGALQPVNAAQHRNVVVESFGHMCGAISMTLQLKMQPVSSTHMEAQTCNICIHMLACACNAYNEY